MGYAGQWRNKNYKIHLNNIKQLFEFYRSFLLTGNDRKSKVRKIRNESKKRVQQVYNRQAENTSTLVKLNACNNKLPLNIWLQQKTPHTFIYVYIYTYTYLNIVGSIII